MAFDALTGSRSTYDPDGNQTTLQTDAGEWQVAWNAENRPVHFSRGNEQITCEYDYMGRRTGKTRIVNGVTQKTSRYHYHGYHLLAETGNEDGNTYTHTWLWNPTEGHSTPLSMQNITGKLTLETRK